MREKEEERKASGKVRDKEKDTERKIKGARKKKREWEIKRE